MKPGINLFANRAHLRCYETLNFCKYNNKNLQAA